MRNYKFATEIGNSKLSILLDCIRDDIKDYYTSGEMLIRELDEGILDVGITTFENSYFRRVDSKSKQIVFKADNPGEGRLGRLDAKGDQLKGIMIDYCLSMKKLADKYQN